MRYVVVGAGAIGGALAASLHIAGRDVTLVARGARLGELQSDGIVLDNCGLLKRTRPNVSTIEACSRADVLFLAVKAQALTSLASHLPALVGPQTSVIPLVNGLPWWFATSSGASVVKVADPDCKLTRTISTSAILGAVVYTNALLDAQRVIRVTSKQHLILGRSGARNETDQATADDLGTAGLKVDLVANILPQLWSKVALNCATNPISVITERGVSELIEDSALKPVVVGVLEEIVGLAHAAGCTPSMTIDSMVARCVLAGPFRTSMLQDYLARRPLELAAICDAPLELANQLGVTMPTTKTVRHLALAKANLAAT